jgi:hypothetical protein
MDVELCRAIKEKTRGQISNFLPPYFSHVAA